MVEHATDASTPGLLRLMAIFLVMAEGVCSDLTLLSWLCMTAHTPQHTDMCDLPSAGATTATGPATTSHSSQLGSDPGTQGMPGIIGGLHGSSAPPPPQATAAAMAGIPAWFGGHGGSREPASQLIRQDGVPSSAASVAASGDGSPSGAAPHHGGGATAVQVRCGMGTLFE